MRDLFGNINSILNHIITNVAPPHVEFNYCPAYLMQILANMTTKKKTEINDHSNVLGRDVKGKYADAKESFIISSGEIPGFKQLKIGGLADPHLQITYYLIAYNTFVSTV